MTDYIKTNFGLYNDKNDPIYEGFYKPSDGRWNGWLQPYCDKNTFKKICKDIIPSQTELDRYDDGEYWEDFKNQQPNKDGLYDVAWGICWMSEED